MNPEERFLKYVLFDTVSDEDSASAPSTPGQLKLGAFLEAELKEMGLCGVKLDKYGYLYGYLPASEGVDTAPIGFVSHMDTAPGTPGAGVKPRIIKYEGGDIELSSSVYTKEADFPFIKNYIGDELIVTDGTTLLGADDKAGVAEIFTAFEYLIAHPEIKHGRLAVCITPDEEIGRGADRFDIEGFASEYAYTVDGGALGEIEYENFNGAGALLRFNGVNIHPGSAKNRMKNAALLAAEFVNMLPPAESPAHTEGYEGFYHVVSIKGSEISAEVRMIIRDHDKVLFEKRKKFVERAAAYMNDKYGAGSVELILKDSYYNMKEKIEPFMFIIERAEEAMKKAGVTPTRVAIRGGTDGATLSYKGLPCPNLSTGGENFHGVNEFISIRAMRKMTEVLINIASAPK